MTGRSSSSTEPAHDIYDNRFYIFDKNQVNYLPEDELYEISENNNGIYDYNFEKPDFNYQQFRSNLVLRWEYKPGSLLYLVWSQDKTDVVTDGNFNLGNNLRDMFKISALDVFLIKLSYRFIH